jgi:hypothetical protein
LRSIFSISIILLGLHIIRLLLRGELLADATPAGKQKRQEDLALPQELTTAKPP